MTEEGYVARIAAIEWHGKLWRLYGTAYERCEAMMLHCTRCTEADFYGVARPSTDDPDIARMELYLDRLFACSNGPQSFD